jgi:hypothetical protein
MEQLIKIQDFYPNYKEENKMAFYPFPNERFDLGSENRFVTDIQRALNVAETGIFDFLTMCHVVVHKFQNGLNHNDPTVDQETWNSIFKPEDQPTNEQAANLREATGGTDRAPADQREGVATVGSVPRTDEAGATGGTDTTPAPAPEANPEGNPEATTNGTTSATDENIPAPAQPDTNPDAPREDMPTVTAEEQQAQGAPAGGFTAAPTEDSANTPSPAEQAAGAQSTEQEEEGGTATP